MQVPPCPFLGTLRPTVCSDERGDGRVSQGTRPSFILEAEAIPEISEKYEVSSVLVTFLFFKNSQKIDRLDGAYAPELTKTVRRHGSVGSFPPSGNKHPKGDLSLPGKKLTLAAPCMLFVKGTRQEPPVVSASRY